jgi:hypothetical protein
MSAPSDRLGHRQACRALVQAPLRLAHEALAMDRRCGMRADVARERDGRVRGARGLAGGVQRHHAHEPAAAHQRDDQHRLDLERRGDGGRDPELRAVGARDDRLAAVERLPERLDRERAFERVERGHHLGGDAGRRRGEQPRLEGVEEEDRALPEPEEGGRVVDDRVQAGFERLGGLHGLEE